MFLLVKNKRYFNNIDYKALDIILDLSKTKPTYIKS